MGSTPAAKPKIAKPTDLPPCRHAQSLPLHVALLQALLSASAIHRIASQTLGDFSKNSNHDRRNLPRSSSNLTSRASPLPRPVFTVAESARFLHVFLIPGPVAPASVGFADLEFRSRLDFWSSSLPPNERASSSCLPKSAFQSGFPIRFPYRLSIPNHIVYRPAGWHL